MYIPIRIHLIVIVLVVGLVPASAMTFASPDGTWWQGLTDEQQTSATMGAIAGYSGGYVQALFDRKDFTGNLSHTHFAKHTVGYVKAGIADFYQTHPKAMKQTVGAILACLADNPSKTCDAVAKQAEEYTP